MASEEFNMETYQLKTIARNLLYEGEGKPVTLEGIIEKYNEDPYVGMTNTKIDTKKLTEDYKKKLEKIILNDYSLKGDFEFVDGELKRIEFPPFTTIFETSGEIIVENDLRRYFSEEKEDFDVNRTVGIIKTMEFYAKQGMLHGFVGNSCPGVYLSEERGEIHIGCDYDSENDTEILPDDTFKSVASVCTDLWWYSIVDLAEFKKNNPDVDTSDFTIVKIPAGIWELSHKYGISEIGYHENLPYATLKKI
jgi:hypothetical protein